MNEQGIKGTLYSWITGQLGNPHILTIDFDSDFVSGNLINATFNTDVMGQVAFDTDQATTMSNLYQAIEKTLSIFKARITGPRQITCYGAINGTTINVIGPIVTGGASQAVATVTTTQAALFVDAVFSDQNTPKHLYPYAVIRINSVIHIGWDEIRDQDPIDNIVTIGGQRRATIGISYFGPNPMQEIMKAFNTLEKETVIAQLDAAGIAIWEKNAIQNLTQMLDTKFEPRTFFDFYIGFADNVEDDLGVIQDVELTSIYDTGSEQIIIGPNVVGP